MRPSGAEVTLPSAARSVFLVSSHAFHEQRCARRERNDEQSNAERAGDRASDSAAAQSEAQHVEDGRQPPIRLFGTVLSLSLSVF